MSQKITAKNLQYNANLPPFLARLRGQHASETDRDGPDPILAARRRPAKPRSKSAEAEDAPLVVDEHGNAIDDVAVGADGSVTEKRSETADDQQQQQQQQQTQQEEQQRDQAADADTAASGEKLVSVGDQRKKRKFGRVIGAGASEEDEGEEKGAEGRSEKDPKTGKAVPDSGASGTEPDAKQKDGSAATVKAKSKKKAKKIKLSFGDDEG
ncbi:hypothetical protein VTG60DRAFT_1406 [Thermothelomyces hinnuleus]